MLGGSDNSPLAPGDGKRFGPQPFPAGDK